MSSPSHARFEELVAGHALSALEPEDELVLLQHLPTCSACERELALHQETLAQLAYVKDEQAPPPGLWEGIRREVVAESGPQAFPVPDAAPAQVLDLQAARRRRSSRLGPRARSWAAVAAAVAVVGTLGVGTKVVVDSRSPQSGMSDRLAAAMRSVEAAPGQTVPLSTPQGTKAVAVAVVQSDRLSLIVDGLTPNDRASSVYVLWAQSGSEQARALATFDVVGSVDVLRDLAPMPAGTAMPELFVITKETGRTAPAVAQGPAVATGRAA